MIKEKSDVLSVRAAHVGLRLCFWKGLGEDK